MSSQSSTAKAESSRSTLWRRIGFVAGVALLLFAAWLVLRDRKQSVTALETMRSAPWWIMALVVVLPCLNWLTTSAMYYVLMLPMGEASREGKDGGNAEPIEGDGGKDKPARAPTMGEMLELIGVAWLANYSPVRPGLFGRIGYHRAMNGIPIAKSVYVIGCAIACGGVVLAILIGLGLAISTWNLTSPSLVWTALLAPMPLLVIAGVMLGRVKRTWMHFGVATAIRYLDVLLWVARYHVVFSLAGAEPLTLTQAIAIAAVSQVANLVPFVGNGLGVREMAVGFVGSSLPAWFIGAGGSATTTSLALNADLINRAGELVGAVVVGLLCGVLLYRRIGRMTAAKA